MSRHLESLTYATRERAASIPFGEGSLARRVDYVEVDGPEGMIAAADGQLWIRSSYGGDLHRVDPAAGSVARVDFRASWRDRDPVVVALAADRGGVSALLLAMGEQRSEFALARFSAAGASMAIARVPDLDRVKRVPEAMTADHEGRLWIHFLDDTWILSPDGALLRAIGSPGVLGSADLFVTREPSPRLFDRDGKLVGPVEGLDRPVGRVRLAGPLGLVFASSDAADLPADLARHLVVLDVHVLDPDRRTLARVDRVVWPDRRYESPTDPIGDACDVASAFMIKSLACDAEGSLWILEHAPPSCLFHRHRLVAPRDDARKYASPVDLSPAELAFHRAEARAAGAPRPALERLDAARPERP
jgi:hypothetical protein